MNVDAACDVNADALWWFCERLLLLLEIQALAQDIVAFEQRHGLDAELEELRSRTYCCWRRVVEQLCAMLSAAETETVH